IKVRQIGNILHSLMTTLKKQILIN
ncbi:phage tail protein, partial [Streptococcus pneumoniae]|nr:phage tail protein [Streptococcus pneumoniae]